MVGYFYKSEFIFFQSDKIKVRIKSLVDTLIPLNPYEPFYLYYIDVTYIF